MTYVLKNAGNMIVPNKSEILIKFLIVSIALFSLILMAGIAYAYESPEFTDGLTARWHDGAKCIPCHYTLLGNERAREISINCANTCHDKEHRPKNAVRSSEIDTKWISEIHKDIVCIKCHVGTKSSVNVTAVDFHRVMSKTQCSSCHTFENGIYMKPKKTNCSECHGGNPHVVHGNKIDRMCVACHGEYGENIEKLAEQNPELRLPIGVNMTSRNISMEVVKTEYVTIGQLMTKIIGSLINILR